MTIRVGNNNGNLIPNDTTKHKTRADQQPQKLNSVWTYGTEDESGNPDVDNTSTPRRQKNLFGQKAFDLLKKNVITDDAVNTINSIQARVPSDSPCAGQAQNAFDSANTLLVRIAYMNPKPEIKTGMDQIGSYTFCTLSEGQHIKIYRDESGEISAILIYTDPTNDTFSDGTAFDGQDIHYTATEARYNVDHNHAGFEGSISSENYNWNELKAIAESIFGKHPQS